MPYTSPNGNEVDFNFSLSGYSAPNGNEADFNFSSVNSISVNVE